MNEECVAIPKQLIIHVLAYLETKPYSEVAQMIQALHSGAKPIDEKSESNN